MMRLFLLLFVASLCLAQEDDFAPPQPGSPTMQEYTRAWVLVGQRKPDEAIPLLKAIIAKDKKFYRACKTLVEAYEQKNRLADAEAYFGELVGQDPGNGWAEYGLAEVYSIQQQWSQALEHSAACIRKTPDSWVCYTKLVEDLWMANNQVLAPRQVLGYYPAEFDKPYVHLGLAVAYFRLRDGQAGEKEARIGLKLAEAIGDRNLQAEFYRRLIDTTCGFSEYAACLEPGRSLLRIARETGDWERWFSALGAQVRPYVSLGDFVPAARCLNRVFEEARRLNHRRWMSSALATSGSLHEAQGEIEAAIQNFRESMEISGYESGIALTIARLCLRRGDLREAAAVYDEVLTRDTRAFYKGHALRGLGNAYAELGDYFKSLDCQLRAVRAFERDGNWWAAGAQLGNIGILYVSLGDYAAAERYYRESLQSAVKHVDLGEQERNLSNLAGVYLRLNQPGKAVAPLERALAMSAKVANPQFRVSDLAQLAEAQWRSGRFDAAFSHFEEALQLARNQLGRQQEAEVLVSLGDCHLRRQDLARAEESFRRTLDLAGPIGLAGPAIEARRGLGEVCRRRGQTGQAVEHLRAAVESIEKLRGNVPGPELRATFSSGRARVYEEIIGALASLGRAREAFAYSERARARSFLDTLAESRAQVRKGLTPEQYKRQSALEAARARARDRESAETADFALREWSVEIRKTNPRYAELRYPEPFDASRAQRAAATMGATILEYELGERRSLIWVITATEIHMALLPGRRVVEQAVNAVRAVIARAPRPGESAEAWRESARRAYEILIKPAAPWLPGSGELLIVPDGILHYLPFEVLVSGQSSRVMLEDHTIAYAPSVSAYASLANQKRDAVGDRRDLLAWGDPDFGAGGSGRGAGPRPATTTDLQSTVRGVYRSAGIGFPPLPNTRLEVNGIATLFDPGRRRVYLGRDATESSVKREKLTAYRRLHFATHAVLDETTPARSGVVLSLNDPAGEDGILRMNEIVNLDLNADVVVLSACQTGLGKLVRGEGILGLTRAFHYAGTPRVVVSLWEVTDAAAPALMQAFYRGMKQGHSVSQSLRESKLEMLRSATALYRHPYFWGPFVLVGVR